MTTTKKKKRVHKRPENNELVLRYEDAWNYVVSHMPPWKQEIVINMNPSEAERADARIFDDMCKEVRKLAESNRKIPPPKEGWENPRRK